MIETVNKRKLAGMLFAVSFSGVVAGAQASVVDELLNGYRNSGVEQASAAAGERLWKSSHVDNKSGQKRSCATCHGSNLKKPGKHARTGKAIKPMAVSVNPERLTDSKKIEKWFYRNCKWTLGRTCTVQEKANVLSYLSSQ
jgi:hypothetical protein